jgi:hypothetical protein
LKIVTSFLDPVFTPGIKLPVAGVGTIFPEFIHEDNPGRPVGKKVFSGGRGSDKIGTV